MEQPQKRQRRKPNAGSIKRGETRNPGGRPKAALSLVYWIREYLESGVPADRDGLMPVQQLACVWIDRSLAGEWRWANSILERLDGKVPDIVSQDKDVIVKIKRESLWRP